MIEFKCSECGKQLRVKDEAAGKKGKCPQCGTVLLVPAPALTKPHQSTEGTDAIAQVQPPAATSHSEQEPEPPTPEGSSSASIPTEPSPRLDQTAKIALAAGGLGLVTLGLSPLFKWINFGAGGVTGISGDGKIVLGITIVSAIALGLAAFANRRVTLAAMGAGAWGTIALFWMGGLIWKVGSLLDSPDLKDNPFAAMLATQVSPGSGLYLGLIGGLIAAGALGFVAYRNMQLAGRSRVFYAAQSGALVLGIAVAMLFGPESPSKGDDTVTQDSSPTPVSPFSITGDDGSAAKERQRSARLEEIEELRQTLAGEERGVLAKFVVERSRFGETDSGFSREKVIELAVRNGTGRSVSRAYFHAVLLTPGREIPWVDEEFNYQITGGLEPGESATWHLSPNMFGAWSNAPTERDDLVLIIRPVRLDGADGESFTGERLREDDAERLEELLKETAYDGAAQVRESLASREQALQEWRRTAMRAAVKAEVEYLQSLRAQAETAMASMKKFEIEQARFYFSKDRFSSDPVIDLSIKNGTDQAVSRFYCRGVLSSPGRETPWVDDTFNYSVRGGIQPGETKQFKLSPNMFGAWGQAPKDRDDLEFSVTVYRLDGADEEELFPSEFSEDDAKRLSALEAMSRNNGW